MGGGPESHINTWNFVRKISHFLKKIKCSKQPKKQNKLNFYFSLSGVLNVRGGWVGSSVWDKVLKKRFFSYTFPKKIIINRGTQSSELWYEPGPGDSPEGRTGQWIVQSLRFYMLFYLFLPPVSVTKLKIAFYIENFLNE